MRRCCRLGAQHHTFDSPFQKPSSKKQCPRKATSKALWYKVLSLQSKSWWFRIKSKESQHADFLAGSFCMRIIATQNLPGNSKATGTWQHHSTPQVPQLNCSPPAAPGNSLLQRWASLFDLQALCLKKQASLFFSFPPPRHRERSFRSLKPIHLSTVFQIPALSWGYCLSSVYPALASTKLDSVHLQRKVLWPREAQSHIISRPWWSWTTACQCH